MYSTSLWRGSQSQCCCRDALLLQEAPVALSDARSCSSSGGGRICCTSEGAFSESCPHTPSEACMLKPSPGTLLQAVNVSVAEVSPTAPHFPVAVTCLRKVLRRNLTGFALISIRSELSHEISAHILLVLMLLLSYTSHCYL